MSNRFALPMSNIPLINLRQEFNLTRKWLQSTIDGSESEFAPKDGVSLTNLLQSTFMGLETYLHSASRFEVQLSGCWDEKKAQFDKPMMGERSLPRLLFHRLPDIAVSGASLLTQDKSLYDESTDLYQNVRNPLFHGMTLGKKVTAEDVIPIYDHISLIYRWVDGWHDLQGILRSQSNKKSGLKVNFPDFTS